MRDREFKELIGNDGEREVAIGTVGLEVRRERKRCKGEEDITKVEVRRAIILLENEKN